MDVYSLKKHFWTCVNKSFLYALQGNERTKPISLSNPFEEIDVSKLVLVAISLPYVGDAPT